MQDRNKFLNEQSKRLTSTMLEENLQVAEILMEMSRSDTREIKSRARIILIHLLKFKVQPEKGSNNWMASIDNARTEIEVISEESPSLKSFYTNDHIVKDWPKVLTVVSRETGIPINKLPKNPVFTVNDVMNLDYGRYTGE